MRVLLVGHGRMGRLVEALAPEYGASIAGVVTGHDEAQTLPSRDFGPIDVAVDFSVAAAVPHTLPLLAARGINVVIGTTGWGAHEPALRAAAAGHGIGVLAAANFSIGMAIFQRVVEEAARRLAEQPSYDAWIHELHHAAKKDAPSGTALQLQAAIGRAGYERPLDVSWTRAGAMPGTHQVGFDGPSDTIVLTHTVRDRAVFARGALEAARWLVGRTGWFTIEDLIDRHDSPTTPGARP